MIFGGVIPYIAHCLDYQGREWLGWAVEKFPTNRYQ